MNLITDLISTHNFDLSVPNDSADSVILDALFWTIKYAVFINVAALSLLGIL